MPLPSLFEIIKRDAKFIVNKGGYQIDIQLTTNDGTKSVNIQGWAVKVSGAFDTDGSQVNTKNVHVTIDEQVLIDSGYPVRTFNKKIEEVDFEDHIVCFKDSSGKEKSYVVIQTVPDENLGLITLWLGDYKIR